MKPSIRVALLGNSFATRVQLPGLRWVGGVELVGLAGHSLERARATAAEHGIPYATDDWRTLLDLRPDLVLVTTPVDLHREMTLAALEVGAAVLCEKPFALDVAEARLMVAAARGHGAWIDHELRFSPYVRAMRERVVSGALGEPWHVLFELFVPPQQGRAKPWCWWHDAARGGGVLGALGSHMLDLVRWIGGEVAQVRAELGVFAPTRADAAGVPHPVTADEYSFLRLRLASGAVAELRTSTVLHHDRSFRLQVSGSEGCVRLDGADTLFFGAGSEALQPLAVQAEFPTCVAMGMPEMGPFGRSFPLFARELVPAVQRGETRIEHAADFEDGLATQELLDAARRSAASEGGWERPR